MDTRSSRPHLAGSLLSGLVFLLIMACSIDGIQKRTGSSDRNDTTTTPTPIEKRSPLDQTDPMTRSVVNDSWQMVSSEEGRFFALMPRTPTEQTQISPSGMEIHTFELYTDQVFYAVSYSLSPELVAQKGTQPALQDWADDVIANMNIEVERVKDITLIGYPGKEVKGILRANQQQFSLTTHVYVVETSFYQVLVVTPPEPDRETVAQAERFLHSFELSSRDPATPVLAETEASTVVLPAVPVDDEDELPTVEEVRREGEQSAVSLNDHGVTYYNQGDYEQAAEYFSRAIEQKPDDATAYLNRGNAYSELGKTDLAMADYQAALKRDPEFALAYKARGKIYQEQGDLALALADYEQSIALDKTNPRTFNERGFIFLEEGNLDDAIEDFSQAIALNPDYALAYANRGWAYYQKDKPGRALQDYDKALELDPENYVAYNNRGLVHIAQDNLQRAIEDFTAAIALSAEEPQIFLNRANTYRALGETAQARADFQKVLELSDNPEMRGRADRALQALQEEPE